jgi:hypothetical protein
VFCLLMLLRLVRDATVDSSTHVREFRDVSCCVYVTLNWPLHKVNVLGLVSFYKLSIDGWLCYYGL